MNFEPLSRYLKELVDKGVPGCELIVCRDHEVLFHECAGFSDAERTVPTCEDDRYLAYSCTKPVTATAAMQCIERGIISPDDPVSRFLPAYADAYMMVDGQRVKPKNTMLVRHLLTMTAGLNYDLDTEPIKRLLAEKGNAATTIDIANAIIENPICFEPGTRFQYSLCLDVMGAVIEAATGMSLADYMHDNIFAPLGMDRTCFWTPGSVQANMAALYSFDQQTGQLSNVPCVNRMLPSDRFFSGGAGIVSRAMDYIKFTDALACGGADANGARVLKAESIDDMRTDRMHPMGIFDSFGCTCGKDYGYGYGVRTRLTSDHGKPSAPGEFGWDGAAGMDMLIDPVNHLSFVYAQHVLGWPAMQGIVHLQIRDLLYPALGLC